MSPMSSSAAASWWSPISNPPSSWGSESRGMLFAANVESAPFLLSADYEVPPGTIVS